MTDDTASQSDSASQEPASSSTSSTDRWSADSLSNFGVIDQVWGKAGSRDHVLLIYVKRPWDPDDEQRLKRKVKTYIDYVASGALAKAVEEWWRGATRIVVFALETPPPKMKAFLERVGFTLRERHGMGFEVRGPDPTGSIQTWMDREPPPADGVAQGLRGAEAFSSVVVKQYETSTGRTPRVDGPYTIRIAGDDGIEHVEELRVLWSQVKGRANESGLAEAIKHHVEPPATPAFRPPAELHPPKEADEVPADIAAEEHPQEELPQETSPWAGRLPAPGEQMRLMPVIRSASWREQFRDMLEQRAAASGEPVDRSLVKGLLPVAFAITPSLMICPVYDRGDGSTYMPLSDLKVFDTTHDELFPILADNLLAFIPPYEWMKSDGLYYLTGGGTYGGALLMLVDEWQVLAKKVRGDLIVAAIAPDVILVGGSKDVRGVERMRDFIRTKYHEIDIPLWPGLLILREDGWEEWEPVLEAHGSA